MEPDTEDRLVSTGTVQRMRAYLSERFTALRDAPVVDTRVCQYENSGNGDFLIDRHPDSERVWFVGGGSGHGFKHGPVVGEYVAKMLSGGAAEPRFVLQTKQTKQKRAVY
jgi:glycine/D-amino acid oxidase-like deaminating enzyme